jgi:hypothetical protein
MTSPKTTMKIARVLVPEHVHVRQFDDELVILDLAGGEYFSLNKAGVCMWKGFAAGSTLEEIAASLVEEFDVSKEVALEDCLRLVEELLGRGLVKLKEGVTL